MTIELSTGVVSTIVGAVKVDTAADRSVVSSAMFSLIGTINLYYKFVIYALLT